MSVLDTFYILFESDAEEVKKGAKEATDATKRLDDTIASTTGTSDKLGASFMAMAKQAGGALGAILSFGAVSAAVISAANAADELGDMSDAMGFNIEDMDAWGAAAKLAGGTAEGFGQSVTMLTQSIAEFSAKGSSRMEPFFKQLGINLADAKNKGKTAFDFLPEIADKFAEMSKAESFGLGKKMGLDQGTIMLLQSGRREVEALVKQQREMGVITAKQAEISGEFNDAMDNTSRAFRGVWLGIAESVLPYLTKFFNVLSKVGSYLAEHKDFVVGVFIALGAAISYFVLPALIKMAVAAFAAFAPFLMVGALITMIIGLFALLYDDVMNFMEGNDSLIGRMLEQYPVIGQVINGVVDAFKALWDVGVSTFDAIVASIEFFIEMIGKAWGMVKSFLSFFEGGIGKTIAAKLGFDVGGQTAEAVGAGQAAIAGAASNPITSQTSNSIVNSGRSVNKTSNVTVQKVEVQTQATDADGISRAIGGAMNSQLQQTINGYDDGVMA